MKLKNSKLFITVISIYIIVTVVRLIFHQPWYDEAHAWTVAEQLNLKEIIDLMRIEGHTFIWYLLIMPFAKANLWYPWPMMIINYIFALASVIFMWKRAPFNNFTKTVVTFSFPFFALFPVNARCYAIGVIMLFLLTDLFNKKLKHPLIFASLVSLCANTSVMALIGASAFGFLFAFDLIKGALSDKVSRKDFTIAFIIMAVGACMILWQLGGSNSGILGNNIHFIENFTEFFIGPLPLSNITAIIGAISVLLFLPVYLFKDKKALFFFAYTIGTMLFIFTHLYAGFAHHYVFLYIYTLISFWLAKNNFPDGKLVKFTEIALAILFISQIITHLNYAPAYFHSSSKYLSDIILQDKKLKKSRIILYNSADKRILPYIQNENVDLWFYCQASKANYDPNLHDTPICEPGRPLYYIPDWLEKSLSKDKDNYSIMEISPKTPLEGFIIEDNKRRIVFELYKDLNKTYGIFKTTEYDK